MHKFGIEVILPYIQKEGIHIDSVVYEYGKNPQIIGKMNGKLAFIHIRTTMFPEVAVLDISELDGLSTWANKYGAIALFGGVGLALQNYPDRSEIDDNSKMKLPIRNGGFAVRYMGLVEI